MSACEGGDQAKAHSRREWRCGEALKPLCPPNSGQVRGAEWPLNNLDSLGDEVCSLSRLLMSSKSAQNLLITQPHQPLAVPSTAPTLRLAKESLVDSLHSLVQVARKTSFPPDKSRAFSIKGLEWKWESHIQPNKITQLPWKRRPGHKCGLKPPSLPVPPRFSSVLSL